MKKQKETMEGLSVTAEKCTQEKIPRKKVYKAIEDYMLKVLMDYKITLHSF